MQTYSSEDEIAALRTAWGEARSQGSTGMIRIFWVLRNRQAGNQRLWNGNGPNTIYTICHAPAQFSCWSLQPWNRANLEAVLDLRVGSIEYNILAQLFRAVMEADATTDPTKGATYYYEKGTTAPPWSIGKPPVCELPPHLFFALLPDGAAIHWPPPETSAR